MNSKQEELIHQRNILMLKLVWTALILDIVVIAFINYRNLLVTHIQAGILLSSIITLFVLKRKFIKQIMIVNIILMFIFFNILLATDPSIANYIFVWFGLIIASLYQNSRLIWFASLLTVFITNYFFFAYHDRLFPDSNTNQLIFINLFTVLITVILVMTSRFSENLRLRAEKNEWEAVEELRANKEYLESFINNTTDAIVVHDLKGNVQSFNRAFEKMYDWKSDRPLGQMLLTVPDNLIEETGGLWEKVRSGGQVNGFETVRQRRDGSLIDVSITISPIRNNEGRIVALSCISRDITERKKTEELLKKSDRISVVGQLAAGVAHEIRNPLTVIKGFVQILQGKARDDKDVYEIILSEVDRIEAIISEYLVLAKPQMPKICKKDFRELLHNIIRLVDTQAIISKVTINTTFESEIPLIECDDNQVKQVFINVLKNAIEAMPEGGDIIITVKMAAQDRVLVRIADKGCGIPEERVAKLGEPFYTTKEKGTGLGLMVSCKIIENHRGSFSVNSQLGEGTVVEIVLPVCQNSNEAC